MLRFLEYVLLFIAAVLLQVLVFDNIQINTFVVPCVYLIFLMLLPIHTTEWVLLLSALICGITIDFFSGTSGLNTMATLWFVFLRKKVIYLFVDKDDAEPDAVPNSFRLGNKKYFRYSFTMLILFYLFFFVVESLSFRQFHLVLIRTAASALFTGTVMWFIQLLFFKTGSVQDDAKR